MMHMPLDRPRSFGLAFNDARREELCPVLTGDLALNHVPESCLH